MCKKPLVLGLIALLGLVAIEACSDSDVGSSTPTAGGGGQAGSIAGQGGVAGRAGSAAVAGAKNGDAGSAGDTAGSAGASSADAGSSGSSEIAGEGGSDSGETGGTGGAASGGTGGAPNVNNTFTLQTTALGQVVATAGGLSLYVFKPDTVGTANNAPVSACTAGCLGVWPIYHGTPISVPAGLLASDFGSFDRGGGVLQSTYKGWPLYTYVGDLKAGDNNGEGIGTKWYSVKLPFSGPGLTTVTLQTSTLGPVIGTAGGLTLYVFKPDTAGNANTVPVSTCTAGCLAVWPIYHGSSISVPAGLLASDFGSFDRGGGVLQSTYKGWPLYTYSGDTLAGQVNGEGIGLKWYSAKSPFVAPQ